MGPQQNVLLRQNSLKLLQYLLRKGAFLKVLCSIELINTYSEISLNHHVSQILISVTFYIGLNDIVAKETFKYPQAGKQNRPDLTQLHLLVLLGACVNSACADVLFEREAIPSFFIGNCLTIYNQCQRTIKRISEERVDL